MGSIRDIIGPEPFNRRYLTCKFSHGTVFRVKYPEEFVRSKRRKFVKVHRCSMLLLMVDKKTMHHTVSFACLHASFNESEEENNGLIGLADSTYTNKYYEIFTNKPYFEVFFSQNFSYYENELNYLERDTMDSWVYAQIFDEKLHNEKFEKIELKQRLVTEENGNEETGDLEAILELELFY